MPQGYASLVAPVEIFALTNGGTDHAAVQVVGSGRLTWQPDGTVETPGPGLDIVSAYDGAATFDTTALVWLVVALEGNGAMLVQEVDYPQNMDTVLDSATWFVLRRIEGDTLMPIPPL